MFSYNIYSLFITINFNTFIYNSHSQRIFQSFKLIILFVSLNTIIF